MLHLVNCVGQLWVILVLPVPLPEKTHIRAMGMGFFMGQYFLTHTLTHT